MNIDSAADAIHNAIHSDNRSVRPLLIVDDDDLELSFLSTRLSAAGYAVTTAKNGADALELLRQQSFPVVITDYQMPEMDGLQFVDQVRKQDADRNYFIVWSIRAAAADRARSFSHGAEDHISKQAEDPELLARIEVGFDTAARREIARRRRMMRNCGGVLSRNRDTDAWQIAAIRLHTEILRATRAKQPLSVMLLHVERQFTPREQSLLTLTQLNCLVSAINTVLRLNVDFALPLDTGEGLVRVLLVLPAIDIRAAGLLRERICAILGAAVGDEQETILDPTAKLPDCAIGIASTEQGDNASARSDLVNAASLIAAAERQMSLIPLPL